MTREEVVKWLESLKMEIGKAENRTLWHYAESIDMAIKALKAKTDGDLISRQDAREAIEKLMEIHFDRQVVLAKARDAIVSLPSAEPPYQYSEAYVNQLRGERDILQDMVNNMAEPKTDGVLEQIRWERDVALKTLEEHGIGFGEKPKTGEWDLCKDGDGVYGVCSICGCGDE